MKYNLRVLKPLSFIYLLFITSNCFAQSFNKDEILRYVQVLSADSLEGRKMGTNGSKKAQRLISEYYRKNNLKHLDGASSFNQDFIQNGSNGANILGYVQGKRVPEKYIVISAHYDHLGIRGGEVYNGADDNASGIGALFALIQYFSVSKPDHSIIFAAFDGEEMDLLGSKNFVEAFSSIDKVILNINMDMISRSKNNVLFACGTNHYPFLRKPLANINNMGVTLRFGHDTMKKFEEDWTLSSDHAPFHLKEIPFIYFGVEDHQDYHKATDDYSSIDQSFYIASIQVIISAVVLLDRDISL